MDVLAPGDVVATVFWWGTHVGVVVGWAGDGEPLVAHCSRRLGRVAVERLLRFGQGQRIHRQNMRSALSADAIVERALSKRDAAWSLWAWNCEDFVYFTLGQKPRSPQREGVYALGRAAGFLLVIGVLSQA